MRSLVFLTFTFASLIALRIFLGVSFLEFAYLQGHLVALDAETDGQFGGAAFRFGGWIQDLVRVARLQGAANLVTVRLPGQTLLFAAFNFRLQIVSFGVSVQTGDEAIAIARVLFDRDALLK